MAHTVHADMTERILLIEDDARLAEMLHDYLGQAGYEVVIEPSGKAAIEQLAAGNFQGVLLDLMLPDMDGLDVCRQLRAVSDIPVLMLTARGDAVDRIIGLELGADDYLPKPFQPRELLARLRAILRRRGISGHDKGAAAAGAAGAASGKRAMRFGRLEIDPAAHAAYLRGEACAITGFQFSLLLALAENAGRVLSRETLMDMVKGEQLEAFDRSIDVHISRIRAVIEDDPKKPRRIVTVRGAGYLFAKAQE